jgi:aspartyl-tRNA(Asn)/glutamyl-tRNA(Gln) amidotransferase subunit C
MALTREQVQHIANLARLELSDEELERYRQQLSAILDYFEQLQTIDTEKIPPTTGISAVEANLRADEPQTSLDVEELLQNAPKQEARQFKVPPVFD